MRPVQWVSVLIYDIIVGLGLVADVAHCLRSILWTIFGWLAFRLGLRIVENFQVRPRSLNRPRDDPDILGCFALGLEDVRLLLTKRCKLLREKFPCEFHRVSPFRKINDCCLLSQLNALRPVNMKTLRCTCAFLDVEQRR